jgi:hypothetical protein
VISAISVLSFVAGAAIAYWADRFPSHVAVLEASGGVLMIGGLALLGAAMPTAL